ncbi:MAG: CdvA-like protein [Thermoproteota archaeon]
MSQETNFFMSIGKKIYDEYGRDIGRVTSLSVNPQGKVDSAFVKHGDGKVVKYPTEKLKLDDSGVTLLSETKMKADGLSDRIPLIWRKDQALKDLVDQEKISPEVYDNLHQSFGGILDQLKGEAKNLMEDIELETDRCNKEIENLNYALVNLEIEHEIGKIDDQAYQDAFSTIQDCLKKANAEKSDLEKIKSKLSNTLLGENVAEPELPEEESEIMEEATEEEYTEEPEIEVEEEEPTPSNETSDFPEPPSVVYVKEASQSSA